MTKSFNVPILFIIFNRPETTKAVFHEIRKNQPFQLFVAADGPRREIFEDIENCRKVREIIQLIDWECNVQTLFRDENLGCKIAVSSAIDWFFSQVDEGIILEDDCLPDQSFFPFCQELLEKYRYDAKIMMIGGSNFQFNKNKFEYSYYFSRYFHIWGWASWKRAWQFYDVEMKAWPEIKESRFFDDLLLEKRVIKYWKKTFNKVYCGLINTWDYQWIFSCWVQGGLSIIPNQNLISNIGFDQSGTHTTENSIFSKMPSYSIDFPLNHPKNIIRNTIADDYTEKIWYSKFNLLRKVIRKIYGRIEPF